MDDDFLKQLDEALTNVGADKYWERTIGKHVVWLSPVPFKSQQKINDLLTNENLGPNVIGEIKRMTMSYAIVGFDGFDLRPYRDEIPRFPIFEPREKKQVKVDLHKYLYHKINDWGTEWIDSAFEVFADILNFVKKENLKDVQFENAKDKREELAELEEKVRDLRIELGMPPVAEVNDEKSTDSVPTPASASAQTEVPPPELFQAPEVSSEAFNPFRKIQTAAPPVAASIPPPVSSRLEPLNPPTARNPDREVSGTPDRPHSGNARNDVIEKRLNREPAPIEIDRPSKQSINPRFRRPTG